MTMGPYSSLFGYLPRGSGIDRTLGCSDLVLIDLDGSLHGGYVNDVTRVRTALFFFSFIPTSDLSCLPTTDF
jgi:hypothetical protein